MAIVSKLLIFRALHTPSWGYVCELDWFVFLSDLFCILVVKHVNLDVSVCVCGGQIYTHTTNHEVQPQAQT